MPVVVAAVPVRQLDLAGVEAVEAAQVDRHEVAAEVAGREALHPAALAERELHDLAAPLVGRQGCLAGPQLERGRLDATADPARLRADRAVAHAADGRVDLDLEAD